MVGHGYAIYYIDVEPLRLRTYPGGWVTGNRSGQVNEVTSELHDRGPGQGFLCCGWLKLEIL